MSPALSRLTPAPGHWCGSPPVQPLVSSAVWCAAAGGVGARGGGRTAAAGGAAKTKSGAAAGRAQRPEGPPGGADLAKHRLREEAAQIRRGHTVTASKHIGYSDRVTSPRADVVS